MRRSLQRETDDVADKPVKPKRASKPKKAPKYPCKDLYTQILEKTLHTEAWAEYPFHPKRKWRFDYAIPEGRVAIEIDGGIFIQGRHSRGAGQKKDMEKLNAAAQLGWRVLHYIPTEKFSMKTLQQIWDTLKFKI